jgi:hypothetical protein
MIRELAPNRPRQTRSPPAEARRDRLRLRLAAIELAHDVSTDAPRRDLGRRRLFALAVRALVGAADEFALDEDVSAFLDGVENSLGQTRAKYRDAMPLDFRDPFVFCVFPRALCGDGKNGEF